MADAETDEAFLRELIISGAPDDADPEVVQQYAKEAAEQVTLAEREGRLIGPVIREIAKRYPQLRAPEESTDE